ncbi:MAG: DUF370 domain-containing protein [Firmicutes bacterium]|nr:DUF370 domain-containing protein [Bacillota bacterium]
MILHLGSDMSIRTREVIAIFDLDVIRPSQASREFLEIMESEGKLVRISNEPPKSAVLTENALYLSPISSWTILRRAEHGQFGPEVTAWR